MKTSLFLATLVAVLTLANSRKGRGGKKDRNDENFIQRQLPNEIQPDPKEIRPHLDWIRHEDNEDTTEIAPSSVNLPCYNGLVDVTPGSDFTIMSPGYSGNAPRFSTCLWDMRIRAGTYVSMNCQVMDLPCSSFSRLIFHFSNRGSATLCTSRPAYNQRIELRYFANEDYYMRMIFASIFSSSARMMCNIRAMGGGGGGGSGGGGGGGNGDPEPNPSDCGITRDTRIVDGGFASPNEYPFKGRLRAGFSLCGSTLINSRTVMTAAHCTEGKSASDTFVMLGCNRANGCASRAVSSIKQHHAYRFPDNDIALLRLRDRITSFSDQIRPVCLPSRTASGLNDNDIATVAGWGLTRTGGSTSADLKEATVRTISDSQCANVYGGIPTSIQCVIGVSGATCQGDSGGFMGKIVNGRWTQYGVTSFGAEAGCRLGYPDGFTETTNDNNRRLADWIADNM